MKEMLSRICRELGGAVMEAAKSKKFLVAGGGAITASFVIPVASLALVGVWMLCQTAVDVLKVLKGGEGTLPESLASKVKEGVMNVLVGVLGSKKALITAGVGSALALAHPMWAIALVIEWLFCQTAVDMALTVRNKK